MPIIPVNAEIGGVRRTWGKVWTNQRMNSFISSITDSPRWDGVPVLSQREADEIVTYALDPITSANTTGLKSNRASDVK